MFAALVIEYRFRKCQTYCTFKDSACPYTQDTYLVLYACRVEWSSYYNVGPTFFFPPTCIFFTMAVCIVNHLQKSGLLLLEFIYFLDGAVLKRDKKKWRTFGKVSKQNYFKIFQKGVLFKVVYLVIDFSLPNTSTKKIIKRGPD